MQVIRKSRYLKRADNLWLLRIGQIYREERIRLTEGHKVPDIPHKPCGIDALILRQILNGPHNLKILIKNIHTVCLPPCCHNSEIAFVFIYRKGIINIALHCSLHPRRQYPFLIGNASDCRLLIISQGAAAPYCFIIINIFIAHI